jgi:hypothetical protein
LRALRIALIAIGVCGTGPAIAQSCHATAADLQALRDDLEIVRVQVRAARNETGSEKQPATDAADNAIRALEEAVGRTIAPSPASQIAQTPRGAKHPHMQAIEQAFAAAQRAFDDARCLLPQPTRDLQKAMAELDRALQFR